MKATAHARVWRGLIRPPDAVRPLGATCDGTPISPVFKAEEYNRSGAAMGRTREPDRFTAGDAFALLSGALLGVAAGLFVGSAVGRVNAHRIKRALARWSDRPRRGVWSAEAAERLEARVLDALRRDVVLARRPIRVSVLGDGLVELTGRVNHASEVGLAGDTVQNVEGVDTVLNHLLVSGVDPSAVDVPGPRTPRAARG